MVADANPTDAIVTLSGTIKDKGAPTILDHWQAYITLNDGRRVDGNILFLPQPGETVSMYDNADHKLVVLQREYIGL